MSYERVVAELSTIAEYQRFIKIHPEVILIASAVWCGPCKIIKPFYIQKINTLPPNYSVALIDINKAPSISRRLSIRSVPCIISIINGEPQNVVVGANKNAITHFFNTLNSS